MQLDKSKTHGDVLHRRRRENAEFFLRILAISSNVFLKSFRASFPLAPWFKGAATFLTLLSEYRHAKHVDRDTFWWLKPLTPPSFPYTSLHRPNLSLVSFANEKRHTRGEIFKLQPGFGSRHSSDPEPVSSSRETCNAIIVTDSNLVGYDSRDRLAIFASIRFLVSPRAL